MREKSIKFANVRKRWFSKELCANTLVLKKSYRKGNFKKLKHQQLALPIGELSIGRSIQFLSELNGN